MAALLLDAMLGRLATYLRMCGHDTVYALDEGLEADDALLARARADGRTVVTRKRALAGRADESILLASKALADQLAELADAGLDLGLDETPTRCGRCNGSLVGVGPDESTPAYAPSTDELEIWRCKQCGQHFWKGSHWADVAATIERVE